MEQENNDIKIFYKYFLYFSYLLSLMNFYLLTEQVTIEQYNDGYFLDLYENLNTTPISKIELKSTNNDNDNDNNANYFIGNNTIYSWKKKYFYFERIDSKYINLINNDSNLFEIGTDSLGNKLYSDKKVINFIEITNSSKPSINKLKYLVITQKIDPTTFLHYSNDYIEGKVLIDIKIGLEKKPCDDKIENYIIDISHYSCKDNDLDLGNTYQKLDEYTLYYNKSIGYAKQKIYLYSRTYISPPIEYKKYNKLNEIKNFAYKKTNINIDLYYIEIFINACYIYNINSSSSFPFLFRLLFFNSICSIIRISLVSNSIINYKKYNKFIFSNINHGIKNYYKSYPWFIQMDIIILISELLLLIPFLLAIFYIIFILCRLLGFLGKEVINNLSNAISEKLKKREERKQRIKKYKKEIKELENNPDIPIPKINKNKLEFFKKKFYSALTCPISLDLFKEPVIVSSGHTYEKEYLMKIINNKGNDPLTREFLNNKIIVGNYLVSKLIIEFNSGINFNENIFNKMIELLKCPLSHKFFHEPYLASIGNVGMTYERSYIENYIFNNKKDPTFNEDIKGEPIKNYVIKEMIDALIEMNNLKGKDYSIEITNDLKNKLDEKFIDSMNTDDKLNKNIDNINNNNDLIDKNEIKIEINEKVNK